MNSPGTAAIFPVAIVSCIKVQIVLSMKNSLLRLFTLFIYYTIFRRKRFTVSKQSAHNFSPKLISPYACH